jgi:hypothetical protein
MNIFLDKNNSLSWFVLYLNKEELVSTLLPEDLKIILRDPQSLWMIYTNKMSILKIKPHKNSQQLIELLGIFIINIENKVLSP